MCHLHTHSSISPQSSCHTSCHHHVVGEPLVLCAVLPLVQKLSTTEHTGFLRAAWQEGLPEGKDKWGSDPAKGPCFHSTMMMAVAVVVVVEPLLGSSYQSGLHTSIHSFNLHSSQRGQAKAQGCQGHTDSKGRSLGQSRWNGFLF